MKERPILFSGPMVQAILDGRKTQTRRVVKPQPASVERWMAGKPAPEETSISCTVFRDQAGSGWTNCGPFKCPYGQPGDRLWVRETWMPFGIEGLDYESPGVVIGYKASNDTRPNGLTHEAWGASKKFPCSPEQWISFKADIERMEIEGDKWRPSNFMPRWASRITLEITQVRVERLNEISRGDAMGEGVCGSAKGGYWIDGLHWERPTGAFRELWESINGAKSWDANPYVWVIEFMRVK